MKRILITLLIALVPAFADAQDFSPGDVITLKGDTIRGFLLNTTDEEILAAIRLKKSLSDRTSMVLMAEELSVIAFDNGRSFHRVTFQENSSEVSVMAKRLVRGKIDVFLKNREPDFLLVNKELNQTFHLKKPDKRTIVDATGTRYKTADRKYLGLLKIAKGDTAAAGSTEKNKLRYTEKEIVRHILAYNKQFTNEYPVDSYRECAESQTTLTIGLPTQSDYSGFRIAASWTRITAESSKSIGIMYGVAYTEWAYREATPFFGSVLWHMQTIGVMPVGFNIQANRRTVRPHFSGGLFVQRLRTTMNENGRSSSDITFRSALTASLGTRVKVWKKNFLVAEFSSVNSEYFMNVGLSF